MDLQKLIAAGAFIKGDYVRKSVSWKHVDENQAEVVNEFDIFFKRELSAADFEFIYKARDDESSIMVRRVSRLVRLGENGEEAIPYETADQFHTGLLLAFVTAINQVEKENTPKEKQEGETKN